METCIQTLKLSNIKSRGYKMEKFKLLIFKIFFKSWFKAYQETIEKSQKEQIQSLQAQIENLKKLNRTLADKCITYSAMNNHKFDEREHKINGFY